MSENPAKVLQTIAEAIIPESLRGDDWEGKFAAARRFCAAPGAAPVDCVHNFTRDWDGYDENGPIWIDGEICTKCGKAKS